MKIIALFLFTFSLLTVQSFACVLGPVSQEKIHKRVIEEYKRKYPGNPEGFIHLAGGGSLDTSYTNILYPIGPNCENGELAFYSGLLAVYESGHRSRYIWFVSQLDAGGDVFIEEN